MKIYQVDDYHKVVAESKEQAKEFYMSELGGEEEDFYGDEVNPDKNKMWFPIDDLPEEYHKEPFKKWEDNLCVEVNLRVAMKHRKSKAPYLLAVSSDLL
jgi:hypothetical protein